MQEKNKAKPQVEYDFEEFSNDVPYKKIQSLDIKKVQQEKRKTGELVFLVQLFYKFEGLNMSKEPVNIKRTKTDFQWLLRESPLQSKRFIIFPYLRFSDSWAQVLSKLIKGHDSIEDNYKDDYDVKVVQRTLEIFSKITLKYMYWKPGQVRTPLFIFIQDDKYDYYKELYKSEEKGDDKALNFYMNGLLSYSKNMIKGYIPGMDRRSSYNEQLDQCKIKFTSLRDEGMKLQKRIKQFKESLKILQANFIQHQTLIHQRIQYLQVLLFKIKIENSLTSLICAQIDATIEQYSQFSQKENYMKEQIEIYTTFITEEFKKIFFSIKKIGSQLMEINNEKNLHKINVSQLYSDYRSEKKIKIN